MPEGYNIPVDSLNEVEKELYDESLAREEIGNIFQETLDEEYRREFGMSIAEMQNRRSIDMAAKLLGIPEESLDDDMKLLQAGARKILDDAGL